MSENQLIIGIDLGTTNSMAALVKDTGAEVIEGAGLTTLTPSVVTLVDGRVIVGQEALSLRTTHPATTFYSIKRFMGRGSKDVDEDLSQLPFKVIIGERDNLLFGEGDKKYSPEEMSSLILKEIKQRAERILGQEVKKAVITVPAYFDDGQRQATRDAAEIAGLEVVRIINEPTAAAIAYGLEEKKKGKIVVYDFGGGTFDVSVLELKGKIFQVLSTRGDTHLGGDDLDQILTRHLTNQLFPDLGEQNTPEVRQTLKKLTEEIKIGLSSDLEVKTKVRLPGQEPRDYVMTRQEFDRLCLPVVQQTLDHVQKALDDVGLEASEIEDVVLVGGSSRIPMVRQLVQEFFGRAPHIRLNPDQVVALGAATQGHLLAGGRKDFLLMDVVPLSLGIETMGGTFAKLIMKNASIPAKATETFSTSVDNQTGIELNIYQGEREFVKDCRKLGRFLLKGFPPMPAGLPRVEVSFFVDSNGLLTVTAKELRSGAQAQIDIIPTHGLKRSEVNQMIQDSFEFAIEDFNQRNLVEFRNKVQSILEGIDRIWPKVDRYISSDQIQAIQEHRRILEETAKGQDSTALKAAIDQMGDLTRDLADRIMGDAAKNQLLSHD